MSPKATLEEVKEAIRLACHDRAGEAPEALLFKLGWSSKEYLAALLGPRGGTAEKK